MRSIEVETNLPNQCELMLIHEASSYYSRLWLIMPRIIQPAAYCSHVGLVRILQAKLWLLQPLGVLKFNILLNLITK